MTQTWMGVVTLIGAKRQRTTLRLKFADPEGATALDSYGIVRGWFIDYLTDLKAVTQANIYNAYLVDRDDTEISGYMIDGDVIPAGDVDVKDYAQLSVFINPTKLTPLYVPAPEDTVWLAGTDGNLVDVNDAAIQNYVANFESAIQLSDGEHVNTALGTAGIKSGIWRQKAARSTMEP